MKYSRTEGVTEAFNNFAKDKKLESGIHQFDETNRFEMIYSRLDNASVMIEAIENF